MEDFAFRILILFVGFAWIWIPLLWRWLMDDSKDSKFHTFALIAIGVVLLPAFYVVSYICYKADTAPRAFEQRLYEPIPFMQWLKRGRRR